MLSPEARLGSIYSQDVSSSSPPPPQPSKTDSDTITQGNGTAAFYKNFGFKPQTMQWIASNCETLLLNVAEGMAVTEADIGWNAIAGGAPKSIVYDASNTITAPNSLPTQLCQMGHNSSAATCPNEPNSAQQHTQCELEHPNSCP